MSAVPSAESVRYQQQRDRSTIPLHLVSFTFLLWTSTRTFDDTGDATAVEENKVVTSESL
jgi:hypothetical protein